MLKQKALFRALHNHFQNIYPVFFFSITEITLNPTRKNHSNTGFHPPAGVPETVKWVAEPPDGVTLVQMIRNCINNRHVYSGKNLHCCAIQCGLVLHVHVSTALVSFYAKLVSINDAHKVFDEMPQPNVVSWNALISGYVRAGKLWKALSFFAELHGSDIRADGYSFTSALAACGQLGLLRLGSSVHCKVIVYGLESSVVVANCLIDMYGKSHFVEGSIGMFDGLLDKDVISWNSVIAACARNRKLELAFDYFCQMPCPDTITYNELINGVSRFGDIDDALRILRSMTDPNSSSWNAILSGYVVRNRVGEALEFLTEMHRTGVIIDEYTYSSILSGIASVSASRWGMLVHCCTIKCGLLESTIIGSALIDMYSKCGQAQYAETLFHSLPQKNIVTWNALISGLAHNGESCKVVRYFEELKQTQGVSPDDITFVNVLAACSHNQMPLEKAYEYFVSMVYDCGITPRPEHVASIIRLMGHHRQLCKAETMIIDLGLGSCASVWRALLGACGTYGELEIGKVAAAKLSRLENQDETGYVILSNINKVCGKWEDANAMWELMRDKGVTKGAGFSWIGGKDI